MLGNRTITYQKNVGQGSGQVEYPELAVGGAGQPAVAKAMARQAKKRSSPISGMSQKILSCAAIPPLAGQWVRRRSKSYGWTGP